jgi:preprotein translocase subunit SecA
MNKQREVIYRERNRVLREKDIRTHMLEIIDDVAVGAVDTYAPEKSKLEEWDLEGLKKWFQGVALVALDWKEENLVHLDRDALYSALKDELMKSYEAKEKALTPDVIRNLERAVILQMVDNQWKDHLLSMDHLKEGIGLQSYGGKDPLIEYKREGFAMFNELLGRIKEDSLKLLLLIQKVDPDDELFASTMPSNIKEEHPDFDPRAAAVTTVPPPSPVAQPQAVMGQNAAPSFAPMGGQPWETQGSQSQQPVQRVATIRRDEPKIGRNDPCYCGSGKKFKKCHGAS